MKHRTLKTAILSPSSLRPRRCPGRRLLRKAHHGQEAAQRTDHRALRAPGGSGLLLLHAWSTPARCRIPWARPAWRTCSSTWPSRAPTRSAPPTTPPKSPRWPRLRLPMPPTSKSATRPVGRDEAKLKQLEKDWKDAIAAADKFVKSNEFGKIIEQNGGEDMNANTSRRRDRLPLLAARESAGTVGLS